MWIKSACIEIHVATRRNNIKKLKIASLFIFLPLKVKDNYILFYFSMLKSKKRT